MIWVEQAGGIEKTSLIVVLLIVLLWVGIWYVLVDNLGVVLSISVIQKGLTIYVSLYFDTTSDIWHFHRTCQISLSCLVLSR